MRLLPSLSDSLFLAVLIWLFVTGSGGWSGLLADGDTGWHIRTGDWILQNGMVPKQDIFSFSKAGEPWFAWEWLTDILYSLLHSVSGLKGIVLLTGLLLAAYGAILFRHMIWRGATPFVALVMSLLVIGASSIHFVARPHVFTLIGLTGSLWIIDRDRRVPSWRIWILVPITLLWVNLHGGFLSLIACLGLLAAGSLMESALAVWMDGKTWDLAPVKRYSLLAALCAAASFANPYGWRLHQHVYHYLRSDWIQANVQEFQSPVFRGESALQFEILLFLGLVAAGWLVSRRQIVPALWIFFWAHSALTSVRHIPLFLIVASPWVAIGLTHIWSTYMDSAGRKTIRGIFASLARDLEPGCRRTSVWLAVAVLLLAFLPESAISWPKDFPDVKFPAHMTAKHKEILITGRTLTTDQWADYLIYHHYPYQKVFVDGRSDFFGQVFGDQYFRMINGRWDWEGLLQEHRLDVVLSPVDWPLGSLLKQSRSWQLVDDDGQALLFRKVPSYQVPAPVPSIQKPALRQEKSPGVI